MKKLDLSDVLDTDELMKAITELVEFVKAENEKYFKQPNKYEIESPKGNNHYENTNSH